MSKEVVKRFKFTCPECKGTELGQVNQVFVTYRVTEIPDGGDLEYDLDNTISGDGEVVAHQCTHCGYELKDVDGDTIVDVDEAADWVRDNCIQD